MGEIALLLPESALVGQPIIGSFSGSGPFPDSVEVSGEGLAASRVWLRGATFQFIPSLPGRYEVRAAGASPVVVAVRAREDLSFGFEFGVLAAVTLICLWGLVQWTKRTKKK